MRKSSFFKFLLVTLLTLTCLNIMPIKAASSSIKVTYDVEYDYTKAFEVLDLVNTQRKNNGLSTLVMDKVLLEGAMQRAAELAISFSHTRPDGSSCYGAFRSGYTVAGENAAWGQTSSSSVMNSWMNSEGHRNNILDSRHNIAGIGCVKVNGVYLWIQCFEKNSTYSTVKASAFTNKTGTATVSYNPSNFSTTFSLTGNGNYNVGDTAYIKCAISGSVGTVNAKLLSVTSSDTSVASISGSTIKALKEGKATLSVSYGSTKKTFAFNVGKCGFYKTNGAWYYYSGGQIDTSFTGVGKNYNNGQWFYAKNGKLDWSFTGVAKNPDNGQWFYVENGVLNWSFTGVAKNPNNGKWFYIENGVLNWSFTGVAKNPKNGKWFYVKNGALDWSYTGVAKNPKNNKYFYIKNGTLDFSTQGIVKDKNGLQKGSWVYVKNGEYISSFTGIAKNYSNGKSFYVKNGKVNFSFTGYYNGKRIVNGEVK